MQVRVDDQAVSSIVAYVASRPSPTVFRSNEVHVLYAVHEVGTPHASVTVPAAPQRGPPPTRLDGADETLTLLRRASSRYVPLSFTRNSHVMSVVVRLSAGNVAE